MTRHRSTFFEGALSPSLSTPAESAHPPQGALSPSLSTPVESAHPPQGALSPSLSAPVESAHPPQGALSQHLTPQDESDQRPTPIYIPRAHQRPHLTPQDAVAPAPRATLSESPTPPKMQASPNQPLGIITEHEETQTRPFNPISQHMRQTSNSSDTSQDNNLLPSPPKRQRKIASDEQANQHKPDARPAHSIPTEERPVESLHSYALGLGLGLDHDPTRGTCEIGWKTSPARIKSWQYHSKSMHRTVPQTLPTTGSSTALDNGSQTHVSQVTTPTGNIERERAAGTTERHKMSFTEALKFFISSPLSSKELKKAAETVERMCDPVNSTTIIKTASTVTNGEVAPRSPNTSTDAASSLDAEMGGSVDTSTLETGSQSTPACDESVDTSTLETGSQSTLAGDESPLPADIKEYIYSSKSETIVFIRYNVWHLQNNMKSYLNALGDIRIKPDTTFPLAKKFLETHLASTRSMLDNMWEAISVRTDTLESLITPIDNDNLREQDASPEHEEESDAPEPELESTSVHNSSVEEAPSDTVSSLVIVGSSTIESVIADLNSHIEISLTGLEASIKMIDSQIKLLQRQIELAHPRHTTYLKSSVENACKMLAFYREQFDIDIKALKTTFLTDSNLDDISNHETEGTSPQSDELPSSQPPEILNIFDQASDLLRQGPPINSGNHLAATTEQHEKLAPSTTPGTPPRKPFSDINSPQREPHTPSAPKSVDSHVARLSGTVGQEGLAIIGSYTLRHMAEKTQQGITGIEQGIL